MEGQCPFGDPGPWSAFRSMDYGFGRLTAPNASHLHWEQTSVQLVCPPCPPLMPIMRALRQGGRLLDEVWLVRENHVAHDVRGAKGVSVPLVYQTDYRKGILSLRKLGLSTTAAPCHMPTGLPYPGLQASLP